MIWQEIYDLNKKNRKQKTKSNVLLEYEWSERRKIKMQHERENKEKQSDNAIKQTKPIKLNRGEIKNYNQTKEIQI